MITLSIRAAVSVVSLIVVLTTTLAVGGCARGPSPTTSNGPSATPEPALAIRFDNVAQTYVDVYLVSEQRQWRLGRVEPGARATLRIPEAALTATWEFVRLAVLEGAPLSLQVAREPRATLTIAQPASQLMAQQWTFLQRQVASAQLLGAPADRNRP